MAQIHVYDEKHNHLTTLNKIHDETDAQAITRAWRATLIIHAGHLNLDLLHLTRGENEYAVSTTLLFTVEH